MRRDPNSSLTRRELLASATAVGAAGLLSHIPAFGAPATPRIVDLHHHFNPPFLVNAAAGRRVGQDPNQLNWDINWSIEDMDKAGIATAVISPPTGFTERTEPKERGPMIRKVNDYGAELVRDHKGRYLQFVYMPLPDVDAALKEIEYGFDHLNVVGAGFATSYGDKYVSDASFAPVFEELNRRKAIAYFHPLVGACCTKLMPDVGLEPTLIEIPYDTARAVMGFMLTGAFRKYRDIKFVFSHSGGAIPMFAGRFNRLLKGTDISKVAPDGLQAEFDRLYYETANASSPPTMAALLKFAPLSQVLFGSDHPYVSDIDNLEDLRNCKLSPAQMNAILRNNAVRLLPQLKA